MNIKYLQCLLCVVLLMTFMQSCNRDEGLGGSSSVKGTVWNIVHYDDDFSFTAETIPAAKKDVYLIFGSNANDYFGDDVETDPNGVYRFDYLRKGDYIVFAYSEYPDGRKEAVTANVKVGSGSSEAPPLYIHTGKAYGTAIIKGYVRAKYYHNGVYRDEGVGTGMRAYIRRVGTEGAFDDVRVSDGVFVFQKLPPGEYQVAVESEDPNTERVDLIYSTPIRITETEKIYTVPDVINVYVAV